MKRPFSALALAATAALLWQSATPAQACSCESLIAEDRVSEADTIVLGRIEDARLAGTIKHAGTEFTRNQATLSVERYLKGSGVDSILVHELVSSCSALHPDAEGSRYLLFMTGLQSPFNVDGGVCSGSSLIYKGSHIPPESTSASELRWQEQWLSEIRAVTGPGVAPVTNNAPALPLAIAAIAIPLVFVLAASFVFPAKGSR